MTDISNDGESTWQGAAADVHAHLRPAGELAVRGERFSIDFRLMYRSPAERDNLRAVETWDAGRATPGHGLVSIPAASVMSRETVQDRHLLVVGARIVRQQVQVALRGRDLRMAKDH